MYGRSREKRLSGSKGYRIDLNSENERLAFDLHDHYLHVVSHVYP